MQVLLRICRFLGFAICVLLAGCAMVSSTSATVQPGLTGDPSKVSLIPSPIPTAVQSFEVWDAKQNKRVQKDVLAMTSDEVREHLKTTETFVTIEKLDQSGKFTYLGSSGKVDRGVYRVTFDYASYTNEGISVVGEENKKAVGRIGVGLRITADLTTTADSVDLSGLLPIGLAAQQNKVAGQLRFLAYGIFHPSLALAVPGNAFVDASGIQKSFEAAAAVRALFNDSKAKLEPYLIGVAQINPSDAKSALDAANAALGKKSP